MKTTESYEQLLERFTKRITQVDPEDTERVSYLKGCIDTVEYLMTGKLPNDGNHDGMKSHNQETNEIRISGNYFYCIFTFDRYIGVRISHKSK